MILFTELDNRKQARVADYIEFQLDNHSCFIFKNGNGSFHVFLGFKINFLRSN